MITRDLMGRENETSAKVGALFRRLFLLGANGKVPRQPCTFLSLAMS